MTVPVRRSPFESSRTPSSPTGLPRRKLINLTYLPSKESTSIYFDAHCVANAPRPLRPSEYSYDADSALLFIFPPA